MNKHHYVVIMAGGIGSRFWPMSRSNYPKQFLDILNTGKTLIQATYDRFATFVPAENIFVVTSGEYVNIVKTQLPDMPLQNILGEPSRKNTAPCIAYISFKLHQLDPNATMVVAPADHLILDNIAFNKVCFEALSFVSKHNALITLGIKPTYPNTGYGYIQYEQHEVSDNVYKVKTFTEKPNPELAKAFIASGEFLWNAGIFVWQVKNIISAFEKFLPEMYEVFQAERQRFNTPEEKAALQEIYPLCTNISIDFGIMEKADNVYLIPAAFGWSDLGTWNSAYENLEKDYLGNAVAGNEVMVFDSHNNMVQAQTDKLVLLQGMEDFIVVDTEDVLLICKKEKEQEIKEYVAEVKGTKAINICDMTPLNNILFLDIETVSQYPTYDEVPEAWKELWTAKSAFLLRGKEDETVESVYGKSAIYAEFGKIVCISCGLIQGNSEGKKLILKSFYGDDEKLILLRFCEMLKRWAMDSNKFLCAHNGKEFDFPYLCRRMIINGMIIPPILNTAGKKPWEVSHLDTMELWKFGDFKNYTSLNLLAHTLGIPTPKDDIDGKMVGDVYWKQKDIQRIATYCQKDVVTATQVYLRLHNEAMILPDNIEIKD